VPVIRAQVGDWIVVPGAHEDEPARRGLVVGLLHPDGTPPLRVRWLDDEHVSLIVPPPDAHVQRAASTAPQ
jgi:hypothetical protein